MNVSHIFAKYTIAALLCTLLSLFALATKPLPVGAQAEASVCQGAGGTLQGGKCVINGSTSDGDKDPFEANGIFSRITSLVAYIVGAVSVLMIVVGGLRYVLSQGDPQATQNAKNTILYAAVGLVVAFGAYAIANFVLTQIAGA